MRKFLLIKNIQVQDANAFSSPYTAGFPAMTAWLGFMHALQRRVCEQEGQDKTRFEAVAVVCHSFNLRAVGNAFILPKRSPTSKEAGKMNKGTPPSIIHEPKCHLEVSLLIEHNITQENEVDTLREAVKTILLTMRIAGGDILQFGEVSSKTVDEDNEGELQKIKRQLMPGYFIKERRDLMLAAMAEGQDALDALLGYLKITKHDDGSWSKKESGWLVPIVTGFHGLTELSKVQGQRNNETPHRFAESVVTLGEFVMPYRAKRLDDMLWHYHDLGNNLYLCQQKESM